MKDEEMKEVRLSSETVFEGRILNVQKWQVRLPDGGTSTREVALHRGASAVVPVDDEGNVYLVRQFRCPFEKVMTEIPAGKLDFVDEDRLAAAKRELKEETGFTAGKWVHLTDMATTPGFTNELIGLYLATDLTRGDADPDEDEFLDLVRLPLSKAVEMVNSGEIYDSKTIVGLLMAASRLNGEH